MDSAIGVPKSSTTAQSLLGLLLDEVNKFDVNDLRKQPRKGAFGYAHRDEPAFLTGGILRKRRSPFRLGIQRLEIILREHSEGQVALGRCFLHAQDKVFSGPEFPHVENGFIPDPFDHAGDPFRPIAVGSVVTYKNFGRIRSHFF